MQQRCTLHCCLHLYAHRTSTHIQTKKNPFPPLPFGDAVCQRPKNFRASERWRPRSIECGIHLFCSFVVDFPALDDPRSTTLHGTPRHSTAALWSPHFTALPAAVQQKALTAAHCRALQPDRQKRPLQAGDRPLCPALRRAKPGHCEAVSRLPEDHRVAALSFVSFLLCFPPDHLADRRPFFSQSLPVNPLMLPFSSPVFCFLSLFAFYRLNSLSL